MSHPKPELSWKETRLFALVVLIAVVLLVLSSAGCQSYSKKTYYNPPKYHPKTGEPLVFEEAEKSGVPDWSAGKALNVSGVKAP